MLSAYREPESLVIPVNVLGYLNIAVVINCNLDAHLNVPFRPFWFQSLATRALVKVNNRILFAPKVTVPENTSINPASDC